MQIRSLFFALFTAGALAGTPAIALAATEGPNSPSTTISDSSLSGVAWSDPNNTQASDNSRASASLNNDQNTQYLKATNFGFSIPSGATIDGIVVAWEVSAQFSDSPDTRDNRVRIVKGGAVGATDKSHATRDWPTSDTYHSYGGAADLWGESWTAADINASDFGAVLSAKQVGMFGNSARIDHVRITVYYTEAGDTTLPELSGASAAATGTATADLTVTTDEDNGTLYGVVTQSATAPSAAQVKAGQDYTGSAAVFADDQAISSTGTKTFNATGLSPGTTYYAHFMHEDDAENQSDVASSGAFITDGGPTAVLLRLDRMKASTATGGTVCFTPATNGTEASVQVAFPAGFTVNGTAGNWTVNTDDLPLGGTAWPGIDTATAVSGQVVTFPSGDLSVGTLYCFNFSGTSTLTTGSAGSDQDGSITTRTSAPATIDSAEYAVAIISDDQITINATVPATFSFDLSANSDTFQSDLSASAVVSTSGIDVTIATNAANGWIVWLKSANAGLDSATAGESIDTQGTVDGACTELVEGSDYYQLAVELETDSVVGTGSVAIEDEYNCDHDGDPWTGGTFSPAYAEIATADGTTDGDIITLYALATISAVKPAAADYTDVWTVVGAGLF